MGSDSLKYYLMRLLLIAPLFFLLLTVIILVLIIIFVRKHIILNRIQKEGAADQPFQFDVVMLQNQGKREYQQDSFYISDKDNKALISEKGLMAVVADGMGGLQDGKAISELTVSTFKNMFQSSSVNDPQKFLTECINNAEAYVDNYLYSNSLKGGSTVVCTVVKGRRLYYASVGDSSIFLIRGNDVKLLNRYHNYAAILQIRVRQGMITQEEADTDPMRARITSFIGMGEVNEIDLSPEPIPIYPNDILLLCSDGVATALGNDAILNLISSGDFSESGNRIEAAILAQNIRNQDNFSAIIIKCTDNIHYGGN